MDQLVDFIWLLIVALIGIAGGLGGGAAGSKAVTRWSINRALNSNGLGEGGNMFGVVKEIKDDVNLLHNKVDGLNTNMIRIGNTIFMLSEYTRLECKILGTISPESKREVEDLKNQLRRAGYGDIPMEPGWLRFERSPPSQANI